MQQQQQHYHRHHHRLINLIIFSLSYDTRICDVWPEFGANGKSSLTLADVLRHESGLSSVDTSISVEDLAADRVKQNAVGAVFEKQTPQ